MLAVTNWIDQITGGGFQSRRPPRGHSTGFQSDSASPAKIMRGAGGYRGGSSRGGGFGGGGGGFGGAGRGFGGDYPRNNNYGGGYRGGSNRGYGMNNSRGRVGGNWGGRGGFRGRF